MAEKKENPKPKAAESPEDSPGGFPADNPERPPYSTGQANVPINDSVDTGSGQHTPPEEGG